MIDAIGESLNLFPEENGNFVMIAFGIGLKPFFDLLSKLGITVLVRTDNDVKPNESGHTEYSFPGIKRLTKLYSGELDCSTYWSDKNSVTQEYNELEFLKRTVHEHKDTKTLAQNNLFLAKDDLENDMWNVAQNEIEKDIKGSSLEGKDFVKWMQEKKSLHMLAYTTLLSRDTSHKLLDGLDGLEEFFGNDR